MNWLSIGHEIIRHAWRFHLDYSWEDSPSDFLFVKSIAFDKVLHLVKVVAYSILCITISLFWQFLTAIFGWGQFDWWVIDGPFAHSFGPCLWDFSRYFWLELSRSYQDDSEVEKWHSCPWSLLLLNIAMLPTATLDIWAERFILAIFFHPTVKCHYHPLFAISLRVSFFRRSI